MKRFGYKELCFNTVDGRGSRIFNSLIGGRVSRKLNSLLDDYHLLLVQSFPGIFFVHTGHRNSISVWTDLEEFSWGELEGFQLDFFTNFVRITIC